MIFKSIDNLASQAKLYTKYLNMKTKLNKTIANIYFNKGCLKHKLTPTYAKTTGQKQQLLDRRTVENKGKLIPDVVSIYVILSLQYNIFVLSEILY